MSAQVKARLLLTALVLIPYFRLISMSGVIITDDVFVSDIMNAEFPARIAVGRLISNGELPVWLTDGCGGYPLAAGGGGATDPATLLLFGLLPPVVALNVFIALVLLLAAHGTYSLARDLEVGPPGALLAGFSFAYSGFMVCQLKHLGIVLIVAWFPVALLLLERAVGRRAALPTVPLSAAHSDLDRARALAAFSFVFGLQILAGFPQTAYICALFYCSYALLRGWRWLKERPLFGLVGGLGLGLAMGTAVALGMVLFIPMAELRELSDRSGGAALDWIGLTSYWPRNILTFLVPYVNGDVGDDTYVGKSLFWEDYGYVGFIPLLLAIYASAREFRTQPVALIAAGALAAYLIVLGPPSPLFQVAYRLLPGMKSFRFPTRFLFLTDFGLALLAGVGLTRLQRTAGDFLSRRGSPRGGRALCVALVAVTVGDLLFHQLRQNPIVEAGEWMSPPATVEAISRDAATRKGPFRIFTPGHYDLHSRASTLAQGWKDVAPLLAYRDFIQPATNIFWGLSSADCYAGIAPKSVVALWGDHNGHSSLIRKTYEPSGAALKVTDRFLRLLSMNNVRYVISPWQLDVPGVSLVTDEGLARVYRNDRALERAFVVEAATFWPDEAAVADRLMAEGFDPAREVAILAPAGGQDVSRGGAGVGRAEVVSLSSTEVSLSVTSAAGGYLVLSDTWYPGWKAEVDGAATPILRANLTQRAVALGPGEHAVRFQFASEAVRRGMGISALALFAYLLAGLALYVLPALRTRPLR